MPGRGGKGGVGRKKAFKPKQQKKRFIRSKDPILAVLMWGVEHSVNELTTSVEPSILLSEDFKAFGKLKVENQYYNKENLPGRFKFKEYCPRVFHNLRKRFGVDDLDYMGSLITKPPQPMDSPGRSGSKFFLSYDKKVVIKSITSEEVALLHQILQPYHEHLVTSENKTLLPQYLGCYRLTVNGAESYWLIMRSVFSSSVPMHHRFDLKGSTVDRQATDKEKAKGNPTLKDLDFTESGEKLFIGIEAKDRVMKLLEKDVQLLQKLNLMDYSLLVGIHDCSIPPPPEDEGAESWGEGDGNGFVSGDEVVDTPASPSFDLEDTGHMRTARGEEACGIGSPDAILSHQSAAEVHFPSASPLPDAEQLVAQALDVEGDSVPDSPSTVTASALQGDGIHQHCLALVRGEKEMEIALHEGKYPVIDVLTDVFAIPSASDSPKAHVYFMGLIDVLTNYGARKRAAHAAKTMKHGAGAEISTVKPDQYARRFLEFISKCIV